MKDGCHASLQEKLILAPLQRNGKNNQGNSFAMHKTSKKSTGITSKNQAVICFFPDFPTIFIFKPLLKDPFAEV